MTASSPSVRLGIDQENRRAGRSVWPQTTPLPATPQSTLRRPTELGFPRKGEGKDRRRRRQPLTAEGKVRSRKDGPAWGALPLLGLQEHGSQSFPGSRAAAPLSHLRPCASGSRRVGRTAYPHKGDPHSSRRPMRGTNISPAERLSPRDCRLRGTLFALQRLA